MSRASKLKLSRTQTHIARRKENNAKKALEAIRAEREVLIAKIAELEEKLKEVEGASRY